MPIYTPQIRGRLAGASPFFLAFAVLILLWVMATPYREQFEPSYDDLPTLVDALLLKPGASWHTWFTRGYADFWTIYPEWPNHATRFCRPAFTVMVYLAHFALGTNWSAYLVINYLAIAGLAAVVFQISRTALRLGGWPSLGAVLLVLQSPPIVKSEALTSIPFASETIASALVGGAFLAVMLRRDFLCVALLVLAVFTKETAVWAPGAAAVTVFLRDGGSQSMRRRLPRAAAMLIPLLLWLGLRYGFFGGLGGTYATEDYTGLMPAVAQAASKLAHLPRLLANHGSYIGYFSDTRARMIELPLHLLIYLILAVPLALCAWRGLRGARDAVLGLAPAPSWFVILWAGFGIGFYLALPMENVRYALAAVVFLWPALLAEFLSHRSRVLLAGLGACLLLSLSNTEWLVASTVEPKHNEEEQPWTRPKARLIQALHDLPAGLRQVYILPNLGIPHVGPDYLAAFYGKTAEIIVISELSPHCGDAQTPLHYEHTTANGIVTLTLALPECATFSFYTDGNVGPIVDGKLRRNASMSYDFFDTKITRLPHAVDLGHRMEVRIQPRGPARFIIDPAENGGLVWFDILESP